MTHKTVSAYCYQCVNGPDLLTVEVVDGVAKAVEPNFGVRGLHPPASWPWRAAGS